MLCAFQNEPLPVREVLDNFLIQIVEQAEGQDLRLCGHDRFLTLIGMHPLNVDGERSVEFHAEERKGGNWKLWVTGAPRNTIQFSGDSLTGHGWKRPESVGVYAGPGIVTITTPLGEFKLDLT